MGDDKLGLIKAVIIRAWSKETASPLSADAWTEENPSLGQCAVTALLVHEMMGGHIIQTIVREFGSYYYNILSDGSVCDLTKGQFPQGTDILQGEIISREDLLGSDRAKAARTQERYALLLSRFVDVFLG